MSFQPVKPLRKSFFQFHVKIKKQPSFSVSFAQTEFSCLRQKLILLLGYLLSFPCYRGLVAALNTTFLKIVS